MMRFVEHRIGDQRMLRLIRMWLTTAVMENDVHQPATKGTPQGAVISPLLANIYLHYAYDLWAEGRSAMSVPTAINLNKHRQAGHARQANFHTHQDGTVSRR